MEATAKVGAYVPAEVRRRLEDRARSAGTSLNVAITEALATSVGVEPPPRPDRVPARNALPALAAAAGKAGQITVADAARLLRLTPDGARVRLADAVRRGLLVRRTVPQPGKGGRMHVYRPAGWEALVGAPAD
ncbi:MAG TPA: hypothetical protein VHU86_01335 [Solirubrobacterales bacterium]|nr:hypothetical protein [Solirubrobacterales bacterium]